MNVMFSRFWPSDAFTVTGGTPRRDRANCDWTCANRRSRRRFGQSRDRAGQAGGERVDPAGDLRGRGRSHAAGRGQQTPECGAGRGLEAVDQRGCELCGALGLRAAPQSDASATRSDAPCGCAGGRPSAIARIAACATGVRTQALPATVLGSRRIAPVAARSGRVRQERHRGDY